MQKSKQKLNALLDRHPWVLQFTIALGIVAIALAATFYQGISGKVSAFTIPGLPRLSRIDIPATGAVWHTGETQSVHWVIGGELHWKGGTSIYDKIGRGALYITNGDQMMEVRAFDITIGDITDIGMGINDYVVGSTNFRLGYPANRTYWFEVALHTDYYDPSLPPTQQDYRVIGNKFQIVPATLPHITSINPSSGLIDSQFTLTGTNFGDTHDPDTDVIWFSTDNGIEEAEVVSWSDTQIVARVPGDAVAGLHTINVALKLGVNGGPLYSNKVDFTVTPPASMPVPITATYYSSTFSVAPYNVAPTALDYLKADFSPVLVGSGFNIDFAISFLNASDQPVWTATDYPDSFDTDGYLMVTTDREGELSSPDGYLLGWLQGNPAKFNQIRSVRFRIYMATMDITAGGPWVQSVTLQYEQASTADIGVINFVDAPGADGTVTKTITRGTTGSFDIKVVPMNGFTGQVVLAVGPITKVGSGEDVSGKIIASNMPQTLTIPSGATEVPATVQFTVNDDTTLSGLYRFTISGHDTGNENATLAPADWGRINVPAGAGLFGLAITPTSQTVVRGQSTTYTVTLTRSSGFAGTVTLSDNIATVFGSGVTASYSDGSLSGADTSSILTIATTSLATPTDAKTFTVTGSATDQPDQIATAQLSIVTSDQAITLSLTIPAEGGKPVDLTLPHPRFTLRLYNGLTKTYEKTDIATDAQNHVNVTAARTGTNGIPNGTYTAYARSTRHLWSKSTQANLVIDAAASYTLTFPTLKAGNLDANNRINTLDLPPWMNDYGKTIAGLLGDLNNDGKVNVLDVAFIFGLDHYGAWGDQLPDEAR